MGAALGEASLEVLLEEGLMGNSVAMGDRILEHLNDEFSSLDFITGISGKGLLMGIEYFIRV